MRPFSPRRQHRGAAVLMALFVATLATVIVSGLFWNQFVVLRTIENQQLTIQSRFLLAGALDWARAILRAHRNPYDALSEPWAKPLAETRLDQLGETSPLAARATIAGNIEDAQSRLNLRNLATNEQAPFEKEREALRRLCSLLSIPTANADLIADTMQRALAPPSPDAEKEPGNDARPLPIVLPQDLYAVPGIDPRAVQMLIPYVVVLDAPTAVNVNTATPEVIAARIGAISLAQARALIGERERVSHFVNTGDIRNRLHLANAGDAPDSEIATKSSYFLIRGQVKLDRATIAMEALVRRPDPTGQVQVLWQREL